SSVEIDNLKVKQINGQEYAGGPITHTHSNLEKLDVIDQDLSKNSDVEFNNLKINGLESGENKVLTIDENKNVVVTEIVNHEHENLTTLNNVTDEIIQKSHSHSNKYYLDTIDQELSKYSSVQFNRVKVRPIYSDEHLLTFGYQGVSGGVMYKLLIAGRHVWTPDISKVCFGYYTHNNLSEGFNDKLQIDCSNGNLDTNGTINCNKLICQQLDCANLNLHEHENKEYLDNIDQDLSKNSDVEFNNLKIKGEIKFGEDDEHTNKITTYNDCLAIIGKDHDSYKINIGYYINDDIQKVFIPKISLSAKQGEIFCDKLIAQELDCANLELHEHENMSVLNNLTSSVISNSHTH